MMTTSAMCWQAFLVLHLKAFRFSDSARRWRHPDALPNAPSERDLYYLMLERFARPSEVAFYVSAIVRRAMIAATWVAFFQESASNSRADRFFGQGFLWSMLQNFVK